MFCLSLWEPFATLVIIEAKQYETRDWSTRYRGPLLIHAAKRDAELKRVLGVEPYRGVLFGAGFITPQHFALGAAIGIVDLVDVVRTEDVRGSLNQQEKAFGDYRDKRFAWKLEHVRRFESPIPMKGMQGLFNLDASYVPAVRDQMILWHREYGVGIVRCPTCGHVAPGDREISHDASCGDPQREVVP